MELMNTILRLFVTALLTVVITALVLWVTTVTQALEISTNVSWLGRKQVVGWIIQAHLPWQVGRTTLVIPTGGHTQAEVISVWVRAKPSE